MVAVCLLAKYTNVSPLASRKTLLIFSFPLDFPLMLLLLLPPLLLLLLLSWVVRVHVA